MAPVLSITTAEILDALAACTANDAPDEAKTAGELAEETGITVKRIRDALSELKRAGRLTRHDVVRETLDGRRVRTPAYTIAPG